MTTWSPSCQARDALADLLDDAGALVAEHDRVDGRTACR